jgi:hypothetical protein
VQASQIWVALVEGFDLFLLKLRILCFTLDGIPFHFDELME